LQYLSYPILSLTHIVVMLKHLQFSITCLLLFLFTSGAFAQQGTVAAGGEATGTGGSMSYSIGQVDYLMYSSSHGSLSLGLQQSWFTVPLVYQIPETLISGGDIQCFNASEYLLVGGPGNEFIVDAYGHADLIAGKSILLKPGTRVELHGSLHARISTDWCQPQQNLLSSTFTEPEPIKQSFDEVPVSGFFKVYPNPTTGDFTLELLKVEEASLLLVEIYTMQGSIIMSKELIPASHHRFSLADRQSGVYIIRVMNNNQIGTSRIIKQ